MARPRKVLPEDAQAEGMIRCIVLRDFWPTENDEDRVRAGTMIEVSAEDALDGVERSTLARFKG